ncbi:MAG: type II and III secretion system protein family protein [Thiohalomonadaceae bacterium]
MNKINNRHIYWLGRLLAALLVVGLQQAFAEPLPAGELQMTAGAQRVLETANTIERLAVGDEEVAGVKAVGAQQFLLQGNKPGVTTLWVWQRGVKQPGHHMVRVGKPVAELPESTGNLQLKSSGVLSILTGMPEDMVALDVARQYAAHGAGDDKPTVMDRTEMPYGGEVQVDVRVVEFSRKILKKAGLNLISDRTGFTFGSYAPGSLSSASLTRAPKGSRGSINIESEMAVNQALNILVGNAGRNLLAVIGVMEGNGFARTLARPTLVAQSGRDAEFLAGGEFPVPVPQSLGATTIQYKPYGIRLQVTPTVLAPNRIALTVAPEVSELDFENGIVMNGVSVPSITTRRATTSVELGNGESFVIGGLVSQNMMRNVNKVPGLGDLPLLGAFFKSVSLSREDKELLFVVTPSLVRAFAVGTELGPMPGDEMANSKDKNIWSEWLLPTSREDKR